MSALIETTPDSSQSSAHSIQKAQPTLIINKVMGKFSATQCGLQTKISNSRKYFIRILSKIIPSTFIEMIWGFQINEYSIKVSIQMVDSQNLYSHLRSAQRQKQLLKYINLRNSQNSVFDEIPHRISLNSQSLVLIILYLTNGVSSQNNLYVVFYKKIHKIMKLVNFQLSRILIKFRFVEEKLTELDYEKNRHNKTIRAGLYFRQEFQKNRMSRLKRSVITLKGKDLKIIQQALQIRQKGSLLFNQIKQIKINPKQYSKQKKLYQNYCQQIVNRQIKQYNGKSSDENITKPVVIPILLKEVHKQQLYISGPLGTIYKAIYVFKEEISVHKYIQTSSEQNIQKYKCQPKVTQFNYIKRILIRKECTLQGEFSFQNQTRFLTYVRNMINPFIATYYCQSQQEPFQNKKIYVQKYEESLAEKLYYLDNQLKLRIAFQIAKTLNFLKKLKISHRDLKPKNIMVDYQTNARVIDWGSCCGCYGTSKGDFKEYDDTLYSSQGFYQSYHNINGMYFKEKYTQQQFQKGQYFDIYSFGQILWVMFDLKHGGQSQNWLIKQLFYLGKKCKQANPEDRLNAIQLQAYINLLYSTIEDQFQ